MRLYILNINKLLYKIKSIIKEVEEINYKNHYQISNSVHLVKVWSTARVKVICYIDANNKSCTHVPAGWTWVLIKKKYIWFLLSIVKNTLYEHYGTINITGSTIDNYFLRRKQVRNWRFVFISFLETQYISLYIK
jgi:hypothetical protein